MSQHRNFYRDVEAIDARLDIENPSQSDLLAIAEALRYRSVTLRADGSPIPERDARADDQLFGNYGTKRIRRMVEAYAARYEGSFAFMVDMRETMRHRGRLTAAQAAGVLNVMLAEAKRDAKRTGDLPATLDRVA